MRLDVLTAWHQDAVIDFETVNRDYFRATIPDAEAELCCRIGQEFADRRPVSETARQVCEQARAEHGLIRLRARTRVDDAASIAVLLRNGFAVMGCRLWPRRLPVTKARR
jgi:[ribosomal protein S5]-alanine N-acetyltransferase